VNSGAFFDTRQLGPSSRVSKNAPELTGRELGPSTRVVETELYLRVILRLENLTAFVKRIWMNEWS